MTLKELEQCIDAGKLQDSETENAQIRIIIADGNRKISVGVISAYYSIDIGSFNDQLCLLIDKKHLNF